MWGLRALWGHYGELRGTVRNDGSTMRAGVYCGRFGDLQLAEDVGEERPLPGSKPCPGD